MGTIRRIVVLAAASAVCVSCSGSTHNTSSSGSSSPSSTASTSSTVPPSSIPSTTIAGGGGGGASTAITSVTFTGTTSDPTVTVRGSGLGQAPAPDPAYTPEGHPPLCPLPAAADQGFDYGVSLYVADVSRNWAGGRYRPALNELDCIGLLVASFSPSEVVLRFGSAYKQYQTKDNYLLAPGDSYQLAVNAATFSGTVTYT